MTWGHFKRRKQRQPWPRLPPTQMQQQKQRMRPRFLLKVSEQKRKIGAWHALNIHRPWQTFPTPHVGSKGTGADDHQGSRYQNWLIQFLCTVVWNTWISNPYEVLSRIDVSRSLSVDYPPSLLQPTIWGPWAGARSSTSTCRRAAKASETTFVIIKVYKECNDKRTRRSHN